MKNIFNVKLTSREIEALQIAISMTQIEMKESIERLENHNISEINTKLINQKKERIKELDEIFTKLYRAENN